MNSFQSRSQLTVGGKSYEIYRLNALEPLGVQPARLPYSVRILLENLLRNEDGLNVKKQDIEALARWSSGSIPVQEISFSPARVLLQDYTGVPAIVDLAAMRDAMADLGGDPARINPLQPVELVIDHSFQVDAFGSPEAFRINADMEFQRNRERYLFLKWGQRAFDNFKVVPPDTGIVHQVNLEFLARVVFSSEEAGKTGESGHPLAYPDTLVGTDSHTTMVNGLGVLGWGVGGIEAEAAMLGQPVSMLIPEVIGFRLEGHLREAATATDLVLTVTQMLRARGVVGKFVEFFGPGLATLPLADRATISNMAPEYGATCGIFPVDDETLRYLRLTGRSEEKLALVEAYMKEQGLFYLPGTPDPAYSDTLVLNLATVEPSLAGPRRPQDRVSLSGSKEDFEKQLQTLLQASKARPASSPAPSAGSVAGSVALLDRQAPPAGSGDGLQDGSVVIAAITSCTNTSNPSVLVAAGLLAKKAVEKGLQPKPWVKTSLSPGSKVVTEYLNRSGLTPYLDQLKFNTVGYGCATCIGNSGPLPPEISRAVNDRDLVVCAVLSGNRNFEGRINPDVRANYLASPPLVVAYALAGRMDIDLYHEPLGRDRQGQPVFLKDLWPTQDEIHETLAGAIDSQMFRQTYGHVYEGDEHWRSLEAPGGDRYPWPPSTYVKKPPYFEGMPRQAPEGGSDLRGARVLALLGDSITTDHISPAGNIKVNSPAGQYLVSHGVEPKDFNQYGARRGNDEVMVRGTFANIRLRNQLAPGTEGGFTTYLPTGEVMSIFDASQAYQKSGVPLMVVAGKEYGAGSSRDWAAKGPYLLGVKAVIAESFERIHRSNLIGMGVLPLQFAPGETPASLGLTGKETFDIQGIASGMASGFAGGRTVRVTARADDGKTISFDATVRIDTEQELHYFCHGGILQYVIRQLLERGEG